MGNMRKQLPDGSKVERVNHLEQSPKDNLIDMIAGFFSGNLLNRENLRQVIVDVLEYIDNNQYDFFNEEDEYSEELKKEIEEADKVYRFELTICFVYQRIADTIARQLGDLEFARQIFKQSESLANSSADFSCLAGSIKEYLQDEEWYNSLMDKAHSNVKCSKDILAIYCESSDN
jgi:hypothetical protein